MEQRSLFGSPEPVREPEKPQESAAAQKIYSVSEITSDIRMLLEATYPSFWVEGEISNFHQPATSGHFYFNLKDSTAQIRCVMWKSAHRFLRWKPKDGMKVMVSGRLTVYDGKGEYQIDVRQIVAHGKGDLYAAFEQLKEKLQKEGLFSPARKRPIPMLPKKIGMITSPTGAVIRDMLNILNRRYLNLQLLIYPAKVQGEDAAATIVEGLRVMNGYQDIDVLIVARGGGSMEDLWPFNEETVARAIVASRIPVISAVGHETDTTISDFVSDLRAPTPSAAAELVVGKKTEFVEKVLNLSQRIDSVLRNRVLQMKNRVQMLAQHRALSSIPQSVHMKQQTVDDCAMRLRSGLERYHQEQTRRLLQAQTKLSPSQLKHVIEVKRSTLQQQYERMRAHVQRNQQRLSRYVLAFQTKLSPAQLMHLMEVDRSKISVLLERMRRTLSAQLHGKKTGIARAAGKLDSLSPLSVLERGYSIAFDEHGNTIKRSATVHPGQEIRVRLHEGKIKCEVKEIEE